jgi:hypothetical protein
LTARALLHTGEGRHAEAWADLLACHRLGRLIGQGGTFIEALVGFAIENIATQATVAYLAEAKPDVKALARMAADLAKMPPMADVADKYELAERLISLDTMRGLERDQMRLLREQAGGWSSPIPLLYLAGGLDLAATMSLCNTWHLRVAEAMRAPTRKARTEKVAALGREMALKERPGRGRDTLDVLFAGPTGRGKHLGELLILLTQSVVSKAMDASDRARQTYDNLRLAVALEAYHRANGEYPKGLSALVPKHIAAVPLDLFTGKSLIYKREGKGYILYSVGVNGEDDGGKGYDDDPAGDDLVIRMPPRKK